MSAEKRSLSIGGHRIAYTRSGSGEPIILVHGITTYSFIWRQVIPYLESEYDVIAADLLGCGDSDMPLDASYSIKDHAERICKFARAVGIDRFHLAGHDVGGGIAQVLAVRHPEMLLDVTLINTVGYDFWPVQPVTALRTPIIRLLLMATFDLGTFRMVVDRGIYHKEKVTHELMDLFTKPMQTALGRKAFLHFARGLDNHDLMDISDEIACLSVPVLILRGDADPYLSPMISQRLRDAIPGSRLERIATASHFAMVDEPAWVAEQMLEHMRGHHA